MYIQKAEIKNIRSIIDFEIEFKNPAGWHVLIGDNGAGKSTIIRSIALALVGGESAGLRANWEDWIRKNNQVAIINLKTQRDLEFDKGRHYAIAPSMLGKLPNAETLKDILYEVYIRKEDGISASKLFDYPDVYYSWSVELGFFSVAYGPYRRFEGGNKEWDEVYKSPSLANLAAHLSVFNESVALTEAISWLQELNYKSLEKNEESQHTLDNLKKLINSEDFLPHNAQLESVSSDGVFFKDGNGTTISVNQMSDGYRSVLSMTFELIRQLVRVYGSELVFKNIEKGKMFIDLPGVVLVDEIDAHLHPTWQTRIGQWFLKYFPQLQFIVTTHSPLVCRAAEKGSIWRLAAPGSDEKSEEITGLDRERLIYGNVLDAYGTEVFGENVSISEDSNEMLNRLSELNVKSMMGLIEDEDEENKELQRLRAKFPTENKVSNKHVPNVAKQTFNVPVGANQVKKHVYFEEITRSIAKDAGVNIEIRGDGSINISAMDENVAQKIAGLISDMSAQIVVGEVYSGIVTRIVDFGAFVEIIPDVEGLLHISEIANHRIRDVRDELKEGQQIMVKCIRKEGSKIVLSHKAVLTEEEGTTSSA